MNKTIEEILEQKYITAEELKKIMPEIGINQCRAYIKDARKIMDEKNLVCPRGKTKLALTKIVKKMFGI